MKQPTYVIVHAGQLHQVEALVREGIAEGYMPVGGPFNASIFNPPHPTLAQALVLKSDQGSAVSGQQQKGGKK